ncbi:iron export ABC transporter permease subunit FetB [Veillonella sp. CNR 79/14]|jgi:TIGR00245 family protein|uniref:ABC transporter permease n=1 Tax=Veillonella sp. CNR 79/14 TaxID=2490954 RepID=UPI000F8D62A1|nr:iron export ABC transporter permease subunit FetB [Veillonella sp. CNR 79/14]
MGSFNTLSNESLLMATGLIVMTVIVSYQQRMRLELEILHSALRAVVQLVVVGYLLNFIFGADHPLFTSGVLLVMLISAAINGGKRGQGIKHASWIAGVSIGIGAVFTLTVLLSAKVLSFTPYQMIPVGGMVMSGSMVAVGLCFRQIITSFKRREQEIQIKLALGATPMQSCKAILREALIFSLEPTIDSAKTLGIVALPGMMTGLILAGMSPMEAIKYQIIVIFMTFSTVSIAIAIAGYLSCRQFFNTKEQLILSDS